ncbi:hypothetical protein BSPLISOX_2768 [uncultured Gammaproteobacteria bacterium]|jgi:hypothetical protein|nr:hypothetical protein [uncultured Gammaproteobacteria bacterium]VVH67044.1 hypothetical protein BSPLISOX_2768 [uncultured Gammaproteobacteria bacterium]
MITHWSTTSNPISIFGIPGSIVLLMLFPLLFIGFLNMTFFSIWSISLVLFSFYLKNKGLGLSFVHRRVVSNIRFFKQPFINNY